MNDNLTHMVQENEPTSPEVFSEADLDLPVGDNSTEGTVSEETECAEGTEPTDEVTETEEVTVETTCLTDWFEQYGSIFEPNIKQLKTKIRGLDPRSDIIVVLPHETHEKLDDGTLRKQVELFKKADEQKVLNLPGISMNVYNNGFRIVSQYSESLFLKSYGIKTGLVVTFCNRINDQLIPYDQVKLKKADENLIVKFKEAEEVTLSMAAPLDKEELQLMYRQSSKVIDDFTSKQDAIDWLIKRQETITDINHHLQIDNVITSMLS